MSGYEVCEGAVITLSDLFQGSPIDGVFNDGQNDLSGTEYTIPALSPVKFTFTPGGQTCTLKNSVTVAPKRYDEVDLITDFPLCEGRTLTLDSLFAQNVSKPRPAGTFSDGTQTFSPGEVYKFTTSPTTFTFTPTATSAGPECVRTTKVTVVTTPRESVVLTPPSGGICANGTLSLSSLNTSTTLDPSLFTFTGGSRNGDVFTAPAQAGKVTLTYTPTDGCVAVSTVAIDVYPSSPVTLTPPAAGICGGVPYDLTQLGANVDATKFTTPTNQGSIANGQYTGPAAGGSVTLTYTPGGCLSPQPVTILVNPSTPATLTAPAGGICGGAPYDLSQLGTDIDPTKFTVAAGDGSISNGNYIGPAAGGNFTLTYAPGGCRSSQPVILRVNPSGPVTLTPPPAICEGETVPLSTLGTNLDVSKFSVPSGGGTINNGTYTAPAAGGVFTLTYAPGGCRNETLVQVTVNPKTSVALTPPSSPGCVGSTIPLASLGSNLDVTKFSVASGDGSIANGEYTAPGAPGTYTLTYTPGGCTNSSTVKITVQGKSTPVLTPPAQPLCVSASVPLSSFGETLDAVKFSVASADQGSLSATSYTAPTTPGTYTITYTPGGCANPVSLEIVVRGKTSTALAPISPVCPGEEIDLRNRGVATATTTDPKLFTVSGGGTINDNSYTALTPAAGPVTLTYTPTAACTEPTTVTFTVDPDNTIQLRTPDDLCPGGELDLSDLGVGKAVDPSLFTWEGEGEIVRGSYYAPRVSPAAATVTLTYTPLGNCSTPTSTMFTINPTNKVELIPQDGLCVGATIDLSKLGVSTPTDPTRFAIRGTGSLTRNPGFYTALDGAATGTVLIYRPAGLCPENSELELKINAVLEVELKPQPDLCPGQTIVLSKLGATEATDPTLFTVTGGGTIENGVYTAPASSPSGVEITYTPVGPCTQATSVKFAVKPVTPADIATDGRTCPGAPFDLNALLLDNPRPTGTWVNADGISYPNGQWQVPADAAAGPRTFTFRPDASQCIGEATTTVTISNGGALTFDPQSICATALPFDLATVEPAGAKGGVWRFNGSVVPNKTFSPSAPYPTDGYKLEYSLPASGQACAGAGAFTLTVRASGPDQRLDRPAVCIGSSTSLRPLLPDPNASGTFTLQNDVDGRLSADRLTYVAGVQPQAVVIVFTPDDACAGRVVLSFEVTVGRKIALVPPGELCAGRDFDLEKLLPSPQTIGTFTLADGGGRINAYTFTPDATARSIRIVFTPAGECADTSSVRATIALPADVSMVRGVQTCTGTDFDLNSLLLDPTQAGGTWNDPGGKVYTDGTWPVQTGLPPGDYSFFYIPPSTICANTTSVTINVGDVRTLTFAPQDLCPTDLPLDLTELEPDDAGGGVWSFGGSPVLNKRFEPDQPYLTEPYVLSYDLATTSGTCAAKGTFELTIAPGTPVRLAALPDSVCAQQKVDLTPLVPRETPGVWSFRQNAVPGDVFVVPDGPAGERLFLLFTPSSSSCAQADSVVTFRKTPVVPALNSASVCELQTTFDLSSLVVDPALRGGVWVGPAATNITGQTLDLRGLPSGDITLVYRAPGACTAPATTVLVRTAPVKPLITAKTICEFELPYDLKQLEPASFPGGTWTGPGVTGSTLTSAAGQAAGVRLRYGFPDSVARCVSSVAVTVTVGASGAPTLRDTSVCRQAKSFDLVRLGDRRYPTGTWTLQGSTADLGAKFDPAAYPGATQVVLRFQPGGANCAQPAFTTVTLTDVSRLALLTDTICANSGKYSLARLLPAGTPKGTWLGPASVSIYGDGTLETNGLPNGPIALSFRSDDACFAEATTTVFVGEGRAIALAEDVEVCRTNRAYDLKRLLGDPGTPGTWQVGTGAPLPGSIVDVSQLPLSDNSVTFTPSASCRAPGGTSIFVLDSVAYLTNADTVRLCESLTTIRLDSLLPSALTGGTWTGSPQLRGARFDASKAGRYAVTYTPPATVCAGPRRLNITVATPVVIDLPDTLICGSSADLDLRLLEPRNFKGGVWSFRGQPVTGARISVFDLAQGPNTLNYRLAGLCAPFGKTTITLGTVAVPIVRDTTVCDASAPLNLARLVAKGSEGGVWTGPNVTGTTYNVGAATRASLTYTLSGTQGCTASAKSVVDVRKTFRLGIDTTSICTDQTLNLFSLLPPNSPPGKWLDEGGSEASIVSSTVPKFLRYRYVPEQQIACAVTSNIVVDIRPGGVVTFAPITLCGDGSPFVLSTLPTGAAVGGSWTDAQGNSYTEYDPNVSPPSATLNFTSLTRGCTFTGELRITVAPANKPKVNRGLSVCRTETSFALGSLLQAPTTPGDWTIGRDTIRTLDPRAYPAGPLRLTFIRKGGCRDTAAVTLQINDGAPVNLRKATLCANSGDFNLNTLLFNRKLKGVWSGVGVTVKDSLLVTAGLTQTRYDLKFVPAGSCIVENATTVTIASGAAPQLRELSLCVNSQPIPVDSALFGVVAGTWSSRGTPLDSIRPSRMGTGRSRILFTPSSSCLDTVSTVIIISPTSPFTLPPVSLCSSDSLLSLKRYEPAGLRGGSWSGNEVRNDSLIRNAAGKYTLTYAPLSAACATPSQMLATVNLRGRPTLKAAVICLADGPLALSTLTDPAYPDGAWSGSIAIRGQTFDPSVVGAGSYTLTFQPNGECALPAQVTVRVDKAGQPTLKTAQLCTSDRSYALSALQDPTYPTGVWKAGSTTIAGGLLDASVYGPGPLTLTFTPDGNCGEPSSTTVTISESFNARLIDRTVCGSATQFELRDFFDQAVVSGTWTTTDLPIGSNDVVDLSAVQPGSYSFTFTPNNACSVPSTAILTVEADASATLAGQQFCGQTPSVSLTAFLPAGAPGGGAWSGPSVSGDIFSPQGFGPGADTLRYRFGASCPQEVKLPFTVVSSISLSVDTIRLCEQSGVVTLSDYDPAAAPGGDWSLNGASVLTYDFSSGGVGAPVRFVYSPASADCGALPVDRYIVLSERLALGLSRDSFCVADGGTDLSALLPAGTSPGVWTGTGVTPAGVYTPGRTKGATAVTFTPSGGCNTQSTYTFDLVDVGVIGARAPRFSCTDNTYTATVVIDTHSNNGFIVPSIGTIVGTVLTISNLVSGQAASVTLSDGASCSADLTIDLTYDCASTDCDVEAGTLDATAYEFCEGEDITVADITDSKLGIRDVLYYILDDDDDPQNGSLLASSAASFSYDPAYRGRVLRLYALAGADDGRGGVDLGDPCLSQSPVATVRWLRPADEATVGSPVCAADGLTFTVTVELPGPPQDYEAVGATPYRSSANGQTWIFGPVASGATADIVIETRLGCGTLSQNLTTVCAGNCRPATAGSFRSGGVTVCASNLVSDAGYNRDAQVRSGDEQEYIVYADAQRTTVLETFASLPIDFTAYADLAAVYLTSRVGPRRSDGTLDPACSIETTQVQEVRFGESPTAARDTVVCQRGPIFLYGLRFDETLNVQTFTKPGPDGACDSLITYTVNFVLGDKFVIRRETCEGDTLSFGGRKFTKANPSAVYQVGNGTCFDSYDVAIEFKDASRSSFTRSLCPGDSVFVGPQVFNQARPSGEVKLRSKNGCDSIITVDIEFPTPPTIAYETLPAACDAAEVQVKFTVGGDREVSALLQNGPGAPTSIMLPAGASTQTFPVTGDLNVRLTSIKATSGGCVAASPSPITIRREVSRLEASVEVPLAGEFKACPGSPIPSISVETFRGVGPYSYRWSRGDTTRTLLDVGTGEYTVTVTDSFGCIGQSVVRVGSADTVGYVISKVDPVCPDGFGTVSVDLLSTVPGLKYRFDLPGLDPVVGDLVTVDSLRAGRYLFQLLQPEGCQQNTFIDIVAPPAVNPILPDTIVTRLGQVVMLSVDYDTTSATVRWLPAGAFSCDSCATTAVLPSASGFVGVEIVDERGCTIADQVYVLVEPGYNVFIPNAFSPNADGVNDVLMPLMGAEVERILSFEVYSRWGEPVHQYYNIRPGDLEGAWDGTWKLKELDTGVFVAVVKVRLINGEEQVISGDVGLFR